MDSFSGKRTDQTRGIGPGTQLGIFRLSEPLGRGGMGQVWLAVDTHGRRNVAVKLLPPDLKDNTEAIEQVAAAFRVVHALTHQSIGKTIGLFVDPDHGPYIVMDFIRGVPLSKYAREFRASGGSFTPELVARILRPVAEALDYAHKKGVLHRDIKPQNIQVDYQPDWAVNEVVLIDFGLAAEIRSSMTRHTKGKVETEGTRPYMSPEQIRGKRLEWDGRTDQYALAVVAYELLAGTLPFDGEDDMALMFAIINEAPSSIPTHPKEISVPLLRGLSKSRDQRFACCVDLIDALAHAQSDAWLNEVPSKKGSELKIVEEENDFPIAKVHRVIVGSANDVAKDTATEASLKTLMQKLVNRFHGDGPAPTVQIERKPDPDVLKSPPYNGLNPYLCIRVDGEDEKGEPRYVYFGMFLDLFKKLVQHLATNDSMNPKDFLAIVLARSTGVHSPEIREFMRLKFSFGDETLKQPPILELSVPE